MLLTIHSTTLLAQRLTTRRHGESGTKHESELSGRDVLREKIARRVAVEFHDGMYSILALHFDLRTLYIFLTYLNQTCYLCLNLCQLIWELVFLSIQATTYPKK